MQLSDYALSCASSIALEKIKVMYPTTKTLPLLSHSSSLCTYRPLQSHA